MRIAMKWIIGILMAGSLALASGCSKDEAAKSEPTEVELSDEDLPVEADFEQEAEQQITGDTYLEELDTLDKEIATE
jgi:hypothetical protein